MRKGRPQQEEPASWLATFGDMATLLLTFYVMIYASCTYKPGQWETARSALEKVLAVLPGKSGTTLVSSAGHGLLPGQNSVVPLFGAGGRFTQQEWIQIEESLQEALTPGGGAPEEAVSERSLDGESVDAMVEIEPTEGGVVFRLSEPIAFRRSQADLSPALRPFLRTLSGVVRERECEILVEGHTCDLPIHTARFASNWELSGARAAEVVRFLLSQGIPGDSVSAVACGEFHPRVPNVDEDSRRRNRRVDIQITFEDLQEPLLEG